MYTFHFPASTHCSVLGFFSNLKRPRWEDQTDPFLNGFQPGMRRLKLLISSIRKRRSPSWCESQGAELWTKKPELATENPTKSNNNWDKSIEILEIKAISCRIVLRIFDGLCFGLNPPPKKNQRVVRQFVKKKDHPLGSGFSPFTGFTRHFWSGSATCLCEAQVDDWMIFHFFKPPNFRWKSRT